MAILKIRQFSAEDLKVTYRLTAKNEIGEEGFDISLSAGPAPPGRLEIPKSNLRTQINFEIF